MSTVIEIREAISKLSTEERAELVAALLNAEDDAWDRQMQDDARAGKFADANREARSELAKGSCPTLEENL